MLNALLLVTALSGQSPYEHCITRDQRGRIARSAAVRYAFVRAHACPSTGKHRLPCPGYRIDHIVPLKRCGADTTDNLQWLTIEEWKAKTQWE